MTCPVEDYPVRIEKLFVPPLEDVRVRVAAALGEDYDESSVEIVDCPDLKTWKLCQSGLGGRGMLIDVGGEPFNHDPDYNKRVRSSIDKVADAVGFPKCAVLAAGACDSQTIDGHLGELTTTCHLCEGTNLSWAATVNNETKAAQANPYNSLMHGGVYNMHLTEGLPGKVLRVVAKGRKADRERHLAQTIRRGVSGYSDAVGMGGVFKVLKGKVKAHINPDQCNCPEGYYDREKMCCTKPFLQFYEGQTAMGPDLVCVSSLWTRDPTEGAMHLRPSGEHTHFFSLAGKQESGHYHGEDPTAEPKEAIEYEGYFVCAHEIARCRDAVAERMADNGESPRIAVLGAGAMGCLLGGRLAEGGAWVTFVDKWQEHIDVMSTKGLTLTGVGGERTFPVKATSDVNSVGKVDVIIVQCKAPDTRTVMESAKQLMHSETVVVSFQNGLGNEDIIAEVLGSADQVFGGQTLEGANVEGPGKVKVHTNLESVMGEWRCGTSPRCGRLAKIFTRYGLRTLEQPDMPTRIWMKVIYNCVVSPLSTLTGLFHKDIYCRKDSIYVANLIIQEALAVAKAENVKITEAQAKECLDKVIASKQSNKSSMAMDIDAKRRSEIDFINGRICVLAEKHGIEVPFNRSMVFFVKGLESHYTGE